MTVFIIINFTIHDVLVVVSKQNDYTMLPMPQAHNTRYHVSNAEMWSLKCRQLMLCSCTIPNPSSSFSRRSTFSLSTQNSHQNQHNRTVQVHRRVKGLEQPTAVRTVTLSVIHFFQTNRPRHEHKSCNRNVQNWRCRTACQIAEIVQLPAGFHPRPLTFAVLWLATKWTGLLFHRLDSLTLTSDLW